MKKNFSLTLMLCLWAISFIFDLTETEMSNAHIAMMIGAMQLLIYAKD